MDRGKRLRAASAVVAGALLLIAPITIKNAIAYKRFVPLSLGAGQTFLEGIADYDEENRFKIAITDLGTVGPIRLLKLGPSSHQWLRYARIPLGWLQRIFKTAVFVPLVVIGLILMTRKRDW